MEDQQESKPKAVKKFVIDRTRWYRGQGPTESRLYRRKDGRMCCLGQISQQCGYPQVQLLEISSPANILAVTKAETVEKISLPQFLLKISMRFGSSTEILYVDNSEACTEAMQINDTHRINEAEREERLKEIFERNGYELEFIN